MTQKLQMLTQEFITRAISNPLENQKCSQLHSGSCNAKAASQFVLGCKNVLKMYLLVHLVPLLTLKRKKLKQDPVAEIKKVMVALVKSLLFAGGYSMLVRRCICFLTAHYRYNDVTAFISGVLGSASLIFEPVGRQSQIALYTLNKSMQILYNMAIRRRMKVKIPNGECWLNGIAISIICFTYINSPQDWRPNYQIVLNKFLGQV